MIFFNWCYFLLLSRNKEKEELPQQLEGDKVVSGGSGEVGGNNFLPPPRGQTDRHTDGERGRNSKCREERTYPAPGEGSPGGGRGTPGGPGWAGQGWAGRRRREVRERRAAGALPPSLPHALPRRPLTSGGARPQRTGRCPGPGRLRPPPQVVRKGGERERKREGGYGTGTGGPLRAPPSCCGAAGSLLPAAAAASSSSLPFSPPVIHLPLLGKAAGSGG